VSVPDEYWSIRIHDTAGESFELNINAAQKVGMLTDVCAGDKVGHRSGGAVPLRAA
jgi:hypothetical protein